MDNFIYYSLLWLLGGCCHLYAEWPSCCLYYISMVHIEGVLFIYGEIIVIFTVFEFVLCLLLIWIMYDFYRNLHLNFSAPDRKYLQCLYSCVDFAIVSDEIVVIFMLNSCSCWCYYKLFCNIICSELVPARSSYLRSLLKMYLPPMSHNCFVFALIIDWCHHFHWKD